jgi:hypothetical protein
MVTTLDCSWNIYNSIKDWIKFSDTKAGAIVAFYGVSGGVLLINSRDNAEFLFSNFWVFFFFLITVVFSSISLLYALLVILPRETETHTHSLIYYRDIAENFENDTRYSHEFYEIFNDEDRAFKEVTKQIWVLSNIATKKYYWVSWSMRALILSMGAFFIFIVISFIN